MINLIKNSILSLIVISTFANAISLNKGWNLVSFSNTKFDIEQLNDEKIKSIWKYKNNSWSAYSFDPNYKSLIQDSNITLIDEISSNDGVWIQTTEAFNKFITAENSIISEAKELNISIGWNLVGFLEDNTFINELDSNAIYWRYINDVWELGNNKFLDINISRFDKIDNDNGIWIYSAKNYSFKEDTRKKVMFLDKDLVPQQVPNSSINGFISIPTSQKKLSFDEVGYEPISEVDITKDNIETEFIKGHNNNFIVYLNKNGELTELEQNISVPIGTDFRLQDYFENFSDIDFIAIEAKAIAGVISSGDSLMLISNISMKESVSMSLLKLDTPSVDNYVGTFISGFDISLKNSKKQKILKSELNGDVYIKPIFKTSQSSCQNLFVYVVEENESKLVGPTTCTSTKVYSQNWYPNMGEFFLVSVDNNSSYSIQGKIKKPSGEILRDAVIVSDAKIITSSNEDGTYTFSAPSKPNRLFVYKDGYKPYKLNLEMNISDIILEPFSDEFISNVNVSYDKDLNIEYTVGEKNRFKYLGEDYSIVPKQLSNSDKNIYSKIYPYKDYLVFAASDSTITGLYGQASATLDQGNGLIYDGFIVENDDIYYGTFGDKFKKISDNGNVLIDSLSEEDFADNIYSVVYSPLITTNRLYIPIYDKNNQIESTLKIADKNLLLQNSISGKGIAGKLNKANEKIIFGTSKSKILVVNEDSLEKEVDFGGGQILAEVVSDGNFYYAIDLNGTLKQFDLSWNEIDSTVIEKSSNLGIYNNQVIVSSLLGNIFYLNSNLDVVSFENYDSAIISRPIFYNGSSYVFTKNGTFYKDNKVIGTFQTKIVNVNLINSKIVFGCENGSIWEIELN